MARRGLFLGCQDGWRQPDGADPKPPHRPCRRPGTAKPGGKSPSCCGRTDQATIPALPDVLIRSCLNTGLRPCGLTVRPASLLPPCRLW